MAEQQADKSERTEPPSPYKLQEAKKKGSVAKSAEVNHLLSLAAALVLLWAVAGHMTVKLFALCSLIMEQAGRVSFDVDTFVHWGSQIAYRVLGLLSPLLVVLAIVGVVGSLLQTGPVFSFFPLKPDIKRLNPIQGFKRLFSMKLLFELGKSLVKLAVLTTVIVFAFRAMLPSLLGLVQKSPQTAVPFFIGETAQLVLELVLALVLVALLDLLFTRWDYTRNLRMSKREQKDEMKRREGDPHIRAKRRELERELRKRSASAASVPSADVIITNPDHYAVVLRYDRASMIAPTLTGKGVDAMAQHLKELARRHRVPIIADPPLARSLFRTTRIGAAIPEENFIAVARVLRQAYRMRQSGGARAHAGAAA